MNIPELPEIPTNLNEETQEGTIAEQEGTLSVDLSDAEILQIIGKRVDDSKAWWNSELKLDSVREKGEKYYLNDSYKEDALYDYQVPYKNNRIIVDIETLVSLAVSNPAEPIITEASDTDASRQLAQDLGNIEMAFYEDQYMKAKLVKIARHLMMGKRIGVIKYWFDPSKGKLLPNGKRKGAIIFETRRPEKIVIAQGTGPGENPLFIAEYLSDTVETLISKFPKKKDEIFKDQNIVKGTKSQLQREVGYIEFWFTYYDKNGDVQEGVVWKLNRVILDKIKNPNWNYDGYQTDENGNSISLNFFEEPQKPYIFFNHISIDKYIIDETALIDHAIPQQDILNKRGKQIVENADQASGGLVYNTAMISQTDMSKLIGAPDEKIGVNGDVRVAVARLPYNPLASYVVEDKMMARAEIDNIFGANASIKGENADVKTLGQEILSQRANLGRLQPLADALEDGMDKVYKAHVQMQKVYWDEPELVRFTNSEGNTQFINWSANKIEDGVKVRVKAGSALPKDKFALRNETIQSIAILDPLSIAEGLDKADPKGFAKRIIFYRFFMDRYMEEILGEGASGVDAQASADIQALMKGEQVPVPEDVSKQYLATFDNFLRSDGFKQLPPEVKQKIMDFVIAASNKAKAAMGEKVNETTQIKQGGEPEANAGQPAGGTALAPAPIPSGEAPVVANNGQAPTTGGNIVARAANFIKGKLGR